MDIQHVLSANPLAPAYLDLPPRRPSARVAPAGWVEHPGGLAEIGHAGSGFAFDNEAPAAQRLAGAVRPGDRPVTNGDWLAFIDDGGYRRPELWLSDGWAALQAAEATAPLVLAVDRRRLDRVHPGRARGPSTPGPAGRPRQLPRGRRLRPLVRRPPPDGGRVGGRRRRPRRSTGVYLDLGRLRPETGPPGDLSLFGDVWEWTSSAYLPYPGFRPAAGAVGEYNGKFMVSQHVLRGGSCVTPAGHVRPTYRNFFPPGARWAFSGLRLARDPEGVR